MSSDVHCLFSIAMSSIFPNNILSIMNNSIENEIWPGNLVSRLYGKMRIVPKKRNEKKEFWKETYYFDFKLEIL